MTNRLQPDRYPGCDDNRQQQRNANTVRRKTEPSKVIQRSERTEASSEGESRGESNIPTAGNSSEGYTHMILLSLGRGRCGGGQKYVLLSLAEITNSRRRSFGAQGHLHIMFVCIMLQLCVSIED